MSVEEVSEASSRFYTAMNRVINGDASVAEFKGLCSPDISIMTEMGGRQSGWPEVSAMWEAAAGGFSGSVKVSDLQITLLGKDAAYTTGTATASGTMGTMPISFATRVTDVFRREDGTLKLVHHHLDPLSDAAAAQEELARAVESPGAGPSSRPPAGVSRDVQQASNRLYAAVGRALAGDTTEMFELCSHADDVTTMHPMGGRQIGWPEVRDSWAMAFNAVSGGSVQLRDLQITMLGNDAAFTTGTEVGSTIMDGTSVSVTTRCTNVYRREHGVWKAVHHHADLLPAAAAAFQDMLAQAS